jgi:hypothetical protein
MTDVINPIIKMEVLSQFWFALVLTIPLVLISRSIVAGSRYSPILIIVVFGLTMGYILTTTGIATPGLGEFPVVSLISRVTIVALIASFFVGGQQLYILLGKKELPEDDSVIHSTTEVALGTTSTQFVFILRSFFLLLGIEGIYRTIVGAQAHDPMRTLYPLIGYVGIIISLIMVDPKAIVKNKRSYLKKGFFEILVLLGLLLISMWSSTLIRPLIALPQIFFAMIFSSGLGVLLYRWRPGPTLRALLFAGIPVVLAANFLVGGTRIMDAFAIPGMGSVMMYGFFGQLLWMFGGATLLIFLGKANHVRNLAPGMAGSLSHSGLTGACTAGDLGPIAAKRAPIMINVPFFGHIFVFSILTLSSARGELLSGWAGLISLIGIVLTLNAMRILAKSQGESVKEVRGLMLFSFGWQITAVFGGLMLLHFANMPFDESVMAKASSISHFGLFAAIQEGMFGANAAGLIPFIFAMPFLVHPLVFGIFGYAMEHEGRMPKYFVLALGLTGFLGSLAGVFIFR